MKKIEGSKVVTIQIDGEIDERIQAIQKKTGKKRSQIIRAMLHNYFDFADIINKNTGREIGDDPD